MKNNPELIILTLICLLTVMMWIPYIIARATRANVAPAAGNVHYIAYTAGIPVIRTLAFQSGFVATVTIAIVILSSVF